MHLVGSPQSLIAFEAAARHSNFTRAATELNVSQPAISRHLRNLEAHIGVRLFDRNGNVVELTTAGQKLYTAVRDSFENINSALSEIRNEQRDQSIIIRSDATILRTFVIPSGVQKKARDCEVLLDFVTVPNHEPYNAERSTIGIMYGLGDWTGYHSERIFKDSLFPVCSPKLARKLARKSVSDIFNGSTLLQYTGFLDEWQDWRQWVEKLGMRTLEKDRIQTFNDYELLLEACREGHGIAIGSLSLVASSLQAKTLVRLSDHTVQTGFGYYLVFDPAPSKDSGVGQLIDFLKSAAALKSKEHAV